MVKARVEIISLHEGCGHDGYCSGETTDVLPPRTFKDTKTVKLSRHPETNVLYPRSDLFKEIQESVTVTDLETEFGCGGSGYCGVEDSVDTFMEEHGGKMYASKIICIVVLKVVDTDDDDDDDDDDDTDTDDEQ